MAEIRDPLHKHGMRVTKEGRGFVESKQISKIGHVSADEQESYITYVRHTIQAGATSEWVGFLQNDDTRDFVISQILLSAGDVSGGTQTFKWELFFAVSSDYTSGGNAVTPLNTNRKSGNSASITAYNNDSNDLVLGAGVSADLEWLDQRSGSGGGSVQIDCKDAIVLGTNDALAVKCEGSGTGGKIRATIWGYYAEEDFDE